MLVAAGISKVHEFCGPLWRAIQRVFDFKCDVCTWLPTFSVPVCALKLKVIEYIFDRPVSGVLAVQCSVDSRYLLLLQL